MECQECNKRPATVHLTQVVNGEKTEVHLCQYCAQDKGYMDNGDSNFSIHNLLSGLFNFDSSSFAGGHPNTFSTAVDQLKCEKCGMTYEQFTSTGKFGCANCYKTFNERLNPILRRVHSGNTKHDGKIPKRIGGDIHIRKQIEQYKVKLQSLIEKEEFEQAAKVRDEIRTLEQKLRNDKDGDS
ncbi:UvrB/UvrC motif-containing protein [Salirhabdus salicampi]|uniref:UvrB/UvrC motif-containing protein n=1 Tax=Salirhabdus salicampi TaxID=476102 RepID=UPI0020C330CC|nr:UvrB/UvrC motif-containing protein [Salirhabdus salicampi]MCP8618076.1 UvrB/UvrC motif-containing protein [Salirhabdus salicampi]